MKVKYWNVIECVIVRDLYVGNLRNDDKIGRPRGAILEKSGMRSI